MSVWLPHLIVSILTAIGIVTVNENIHIFYYNIFLNLIHISVDNLNIYLAK